MTLSAYLAIVRRWWWTLLLGPLLGGSAAFAVSAQITPTYQATATLLVVQRQDEGAIQLNDLQASERLAATFSQLIALDPVLEEAMAALPFEITVKEIEDNLTVTNPRATQLLRVSVTDPDPGVARDIANVVSEVFITQNDAEYGNRPGTVTIVERAKPPESPVSPRTTLNVALGVLTALMITVGVIAFVEYLDDTVKSPEDVAAFTGLSTLGLVRRFAKTSQPSEQLRIVVDPRSAAAESYRGIRTAIEYAMPDEGRGIVLMVTSANPGEGKTTATGNLALAFALGGKRVLVIDADLRQPTLHRLFGAANSFGLSTELIRRDRETVGFEPQGTTHPGVWLIPAGPISVVSAELLASRQMALNLDAARGSFDLIVCDTPPVLSATDAPVLARNVDATLFVVRAGSTRGEALREAVRLVAQAGSPVLGVLLNRVAGRSAGHGTYDSYYGEEDGFSHVVLAEDKVRSLTNAHPPAADGTVASLAPEPGAPPWVRPVRHEPGGSGGASPSASSEK